MRAYLSSAFISLAALATIPVYGTACGLFGDDDDKDKDDDDDGESKKDKLKSKRAECETNLKQIKRSWQAYDAEFSRYLTVPRYHPDSSPGKKSRKFTMGTQFDTIGWMPDGEVYGSYKVQTLSTTDFMVYCIIDADGDGEKSSWTATKTINATMNTSNDVY